MIIYKYSVSMYTNQFRLISVGRIGENCYLFSSITDKIISFYCDMK